MTHKSDIWPGEPHSRVEPRRGRKVWIAHKGNLTDLFFPSGKQTAISTLLVFQRNNRFPTPNSSQNLIWEESIRERLKIHVVHCKGAALPLQTHVTIGASYHDLRILPFKLTWQPNLYAVSRELFCAYTVSLQVILQSFWLRLHTKRGPAENNAVQQNSLDHHGSAVCSLQVRQKLDSR